jgi:serpin B
VVSPVSAAQALQLTFNGAKDETRDGMARALGIQGKAPADLNYGNAILAATILPREREVALAVANSIWQSGAAVRPSFAGLAEDSYGAEVGDLSKGPEAVNAWMSAQTHGLIRSILDPHAVLGADVLLLANSVYFKGAWTIPFDPNDTATAPFTRADGSQVACRMMFRIATVPYAESDHYQALLLPYGKARYAMLLVLPKQGAALEDLEPVLQGSPKGMSDHAVLLRLPRFETGFSGALDEPLKAMGMARAFDPDKADFSALAPARRHIENVAHAVRMNVDEKGTVAAAGTVVHMSGTSLPEAEVTLDRPFLYAILDRSTGAMIFLGQLADPSK